MVIVCGADVDITTIFLHPRKQVNSISQPFRLLNRSGSRKATDEYFCSSSPPALYNERKGVKIKIRSHRGHSFREVADAAKGAVEADYNVRVVDEDMDIFTCSRFTIFVTTSIEMKQRSSLLWKLL